LDENGAMLSEKEFDEAFIKEKAQWYV